MHMGHVNQWLRTKATYFLAGICVILMCVWIIPWQQLIRERPATSGKLFGKDADGNEVADIAHTLSLLQQQRDSRTTSEELTATAWETMIYREEAKRYGISASDADVANVLKARFGLSDDTAANEKFLAQFLSSQGLARKQFDASIKSLLASVKLQNAILTAVTLPESEAWLWYSRENQKIQAEYLALSAAALEPLVSVTEKQLAEFYTKHRDLSPEESPDQIGYLQPERVRIEYVLVPTQPYADKAVITQRQVEQYYETHKEQYKKAPPAAAAEEKPAVASYRPLSEVSLSIEKILKNEEAGRAADEQIKEVRTEALRQMEVPWGSREVRSADFAALAAKFGATYKLTDFFSADEVNTVLPGASELGQKAFGQAASAKGVPSAPLSAASGKFIFQLKAVDPSKPAPRETIEAQLGTDCRQQNAINLATEIAAKARTAGTLAAAEESVKASLSEAIAKAPAVEGKEIEKDPAKYYRKGETQFFGRPMEFYGQRFARGAVGLPEPGQHLAFIDAAFSVKKGEVGMADEAVESRAVYLFARTKDQPASREEFTQSRQMVEQMLLAQKQQAVRKSWVDDVRRRAKPSENVMKFLKLLPEWQQEA